MGGESPKPASTLNGAVFLSYASQDAEPARRLCDALRAAGIEVWFDQSELRGGDAWDHKIRQQIHDCALFIPVISANSERRDEGYFRREWSLAVDRTRDMAHKRTFLIPVVIDDTPERGSSVPDKFHELQWTRLPGGDAPAEFVSRIKRLLSLEPPATAQLQAHATAVSSSTSRIAGRPSPLRHALPVAVAMLVVAALAYLLINKPWNSKPAGSSATSSAAPPPAASPAAFNPPPHSIAVLPFVNMSGDKEQEYFSDGLTEELLNALAEIEGLQVAARTSAFSFKGTNTDIGTIARKLNVGAVLEGSVRRSGNTVRITTQLINAVTGFHLWSHTYDRDLADVLKLQSEIAGAVASALKVNLLGELAAKMELGGTHDPAALDAFLRGRKAHIQWYADNSTDFVPVIAAYTEAISRDPNFALAFANRSQAFAGLANNLSGPAMRENFDKALSDAREAVALAPDLAEGRLALANYLAGSRALDFTRANEEYERALALAPGNAWVAGDYSFFAIRMGRTEAAIAAARRAVALDPLSFVSHYTLGDVFLYGRRYKEALAAYQDAFDLDPGNSTNVARSFAYYLLGDFESARVLCERKRDASDNQLCLAIVYDKLGRHADAEKMLAKIKATLGDDGAYGYATIYTQWGNIPKGLEWLDIALRVRDPSLQLLKVDPLLDPLRKEPRFQAIERELKFPD
jgi:TolB-like protein/Flp pilus assembly protein TadD